MDAGQRSPSPQRKQPTLPIHRHYQMPRNLLPAASHQQQPDGSHSDHHIPPIHLHSRTHQETTQEYRSRWGGLSHSWIKRTPNKGPNTGRAV